ncbi:hypothetical protein TSEDIMI_300011 [Tenacibaculum sediminilitoris]
MLLRVLKLPLNLKRFYFLNSVIFFSKKDHKDIGLAMIFSTNSDKGERLAFEGVFKLNNTLTPRVRHCKKLNNEYMESDI